LRNSVIALSTVSVLALASALASYLYSLDLAAEVDTLDAAVSCATDSSPSNCYQDRDVTITSVVITQNRYNQTATVTFLDAGNPHEVSIRPFNSNSSTLQTGESAATILWRGLYTQLQAGGATYVTTDNPVGQRNQYRVIAWLAILISLVMGAVIPVEVRLYRRRWGPSPPVLTSGPNDT
jgi:hypothetical protein